MKLYHATSAGSGQVRGEIYIYHRNTDAVVERKITDISSEQSRFRLAKYIAVKELSVLYERAYVALGKNAAMIFYIHHLMLDDETFTDSVCGIISEQKINAEAAVAQTADMLSAVFTDMSDVYMRERGADVRDICERVIAILKDSGQPYPRPDKPSIILTAELSPSEILLADKGMITGLIMTEGAANSHASILAQKMNIPAVCRAKIPKDELSCGKSVLLDADNGIIYTV